MRARHPGRAPPARETAIGHASVPPAVTDAAALLPAERPVLLYDGVCDLCAGAVQFVLQRDADGDVRFAPLQSRPGRALVERFGLGDVDSVVLVEGTAAYTRSEAALRLAAHLDPPWRWLAGLRVLPRPLRDAVYDAVARSRYRVFGRADRCRRPPDDAADRFLDGADEVVADGPP